MSTKFTAEYLSPFVQNSLSIAEVCKRLGKYPAGNDHKFVKSLILKFGLDTSHFLGRSRRKGVRVPKLCWSEILVKDRLDGQKETIKRLRWAILESGVPYRCAACGLGSIWNGETITLQVDHVNGDPTDNRPNNVRFMCPNCHSQTSNFAGKNATHSKSPSLQLKRQHTNPQKRQRQVLEVLCSNCTRMFYRKPSAIKRKGNYCSPQCSKTAQETASWPMDHELREMVWRYPVSQVASELGVSGNAVKKRCSHLEIDTPPRGHWAKVRAQGGSRTRNAFRRTI